MKVVNNRERFPLNKWCLPVSIVADDGSVLWSGNDVKDITEDEMKKIMIIAEQRSKV